MRYPRRRATASRAGFRRKPPRSTQLAKVHDAGDADGHEAAGTKEGGIWLVSMGDAADKIGTEAGMMGNGVLICYRNIDQTSGAAGAGWRCRSWRTGMC